MGRNKQAIKGVYLLPLDSICLWFGFDDFVRDAEVSTNLSVTADRNVCVTAGRKKLYLRKLVSGEGREAMTASFLTNTTLFKLGI